MIKVAALTSGKFAPSSRFRVRQHIGPLRERGVEVREYIPAIDKYRNLPVWPDRADYRYGLPLFLLWQGAKVLTRFPGVIGSWRHQITWLERQLLPGMLTMEPLLKRPVVFDVDDAIWLARPFGGSVKMIARRADVVVTGNGFLADWFASCSRDVRVVPTAIDTDRYRPRPAALCQEGGRFRIGWIGTSGNLRYLEEIESSLRGFLADHENAEILVMADRKPEFRWIPGERIRYIPWSEESEVDALQQMDVGLMPLPDEEWTRGKCSFKMLQYMSCGIPVVVSPVRNNVEILALGPAGFLCSTESEWYDALSFLREKRDRAEALGTEGRRIVEKHFAKELIAAQLTDIFRELS